MMKWNKFLRAPNSASALQPLEKFTYPGGLAELGVEWQWPIRIAVGPEWPGPGWTVSVGRQRLHLSGLRQCTEIAGEKKTRHRITSFRPIICCHIFIFIYYHFLIFSFSCDSTELLVEVLGGATLQLFASRALPSAWFSASAKRGGDHGLSWRLWISNHETMFQMKT